MRTLLLSLIAATVACASTPNNACPLPLVVEADTASQLVLWDSASVSMKVDSAVGDCLPVHQVKSSKGDSTTWYRIPITVSLRSNGHSLLDSVPVPPDTIKAMLRIEAVGKNGVVLAIDSIPYVFNFSYHSLRLSGGLSHLTSAEVAHLAKVRVGFHGVP